MVGTDKTVTGMGRRERMCPARYQKGHLAKCGNRINCCQRNSVQSRSAHRDCNEAAEKEKGDAMSPPILIVSEESENAHNQRSKVLVDDDEAEAMRRLQKKVCV